MKAPKSLLANIELTRLFAPYFSPFPASFFNYWQLDVISVQWWANNGYILFLFPPISEIVASGHFTFVVVVVAWEMRSNNGWIR